MKQAVSKIAVVAIIACLIALGVLGADDAKVHGTMTVSAQPNVLIIFDTSGSMNTADIPGEYYSPATTYAGSYPTNAVYQEKWQEWWKYYELFADHISDLHCDPIKNDLLAKGYATGYITDSFGGYRCSGSEKKVLLGNYLNYHESALATTTRIEAAKEVIANLINETENVRFGLMRFNDNQGGRIIAECGSDKTTLINTITSLVAGGYTPLAETLAEAGLYFAGMDSWYNSGITYTTPMREPCQKNYIILMTDAEPTMDSDPKLCNEPYINGEIIGDYDGDGKESGCYSGLPEDQPGSDYLDDVAKYLCDNDCNPTLGDGTSCEKQNIITHTIGLVTQQKLLQDTAINGGGKYDTAADISGLCEAFDSIMTTITADTSSPTPGTNDRGCFIATVAYGLPLEAYIKILGHFPN